MKYYLKYIPFIIFMLISIAACNNNESEYTVIDFSKTGNVKTNLEDISGPGTLKVAISAMISPKETIESYQPLLNYIGRKLDLNIQLVQRETYAEINEMLLAQQLDFAFICTGPYVRGKEKYGFEALLTSVVNGNPLYQAYLIVRKESPYKIIEDLKGKSFAFTDPDSNTGALVPKYWLSQINETPNSFFSKIIYTHSHDNSIMAVAKSMVDGASVGSIFWDHYQVHDPKYTALTRIIKKSDMFGGPPLVASKHVSAELKTKVQQLLIKMSEDEEGQKILKELMIDSFQVTEESWYESVKQINRNVIDNGTKRP